jgi:hypothetical protein
MSQNLESACKAWQFREWNRAVSAAIAEVEKHAPGSEAWKIAVRKNAEIIVSNPKTYAEIAAEIYDNLRK